MAKYRSTFKVFILLFSFLNVTHCLYEDQVGKFDWRQSYIGKVKFASFDSVKRVVLGTEDNVVASLHLKNGQIAWRQVLEESQVLELLDVDREVVTVSGDGNTWFIRGWNLNTGILEWEWTLSAESKINAKWFVSKGQLVHVVPVVGSHLEVTSYQYNTGHNSGSTSRISTPWVTDLQKCVLTKAFWSCVSSDDSNGQLYFMDLASTAFKVHTKPLQNLMGNVPGRVSMKPFNHAEPALLLERNGVSRLLVLEEESPNLFPYGLTDKIASIQNGDQNILVQLDKSDSNIKIRTVNLEEKTDDVVEAEYPPNFEVPVPVVGVCRGQACRLLFATKDNTISLMQLPAGKIMWTREEALSNVVSVEFVELPVSDLDASIEHEFTSTSGDIVGMLYRRIVSQIRQLTSYLSGQPLTASSGDLIRDDFGLHKLIILATRAGKLFAVDSVSGAVVWSKYLPDTEPFTSLNKDALFTFEQRNARYPPLTAVCTLLAKDVNTGHGVIYTFDPITGHSKQGLNRLNYNVKQAMLMPYEDTNHLKGLIIMADNNEIYLYPENAKRVFKERSSSIFMYSADANAGLLQGFSLTYSDNVAIKAVQTWELQLQPSQIVALSMRPNIEKVHSQGRVLQDRSVLYKHVNPNLLAIATVSFDTLHKHVLSIYLVDGVTGLVMYSANHKRAKGPVHLVHSENWIVYSYFNEKFRRVEMAAVELYEGTTQSNSTAFSSHAVSRLPHPESQAYILPANPLVVSTTLTERGITSKHLLIALSSGFVAELPWVFLEPRGPHLSAGPEEGYIPYMPELPLPSESYINYNQSLERIRGIQVSPARLESTSLVLIYGLDLFYTRVAPSKTFDVLKEDFDHWLIVMVLGGLVLASYVTKQFASRKALKQAWK